MSAAAAPRPFAAHAPSAASDTASAVAAGVAATAAALLLGAATEVTQRVLPDAWGPLANSVTAWVVVPAVLVGVLLATTGWRDRRATALAVAGGLATTEALVAGYYGWAALVSGTPHAASSVAVWATAGLVSGAMAGACSLAWITTRGHLRGAATGLLAAVPLADGARTLLLSGAQASAGWVFVAAAVAVPVLLLRRGERLAAGLALLCAAALGAGGFAVVDAVVTLAGSR